MNKRGKMISFILSLTVATSLGSVIPVFADTVSTSIVATQVSQSVSASHRLAGSNRYTTAVAISQNGWSASDTIILASGEDYADALTSGPLAKKYNAPILLSSKGSISEETISEIGRLKAKNIIIIGGEGAISLGVAAQLTTAGYSGITRIGGLNRYETSVMVAAKLDKPSAVAIVSGQDFPDALSISSIASKLGFPIILSSKSGLSDSVKKYIATNKITKAYIVGGPAVLAAAIENEVTNSVRLAGLNRYETNSEVLKAFEGKLSYDNVFIATGNNFADALAGGALASKTSSPMILAGGIMLENTAKYLASEENLNTKIFALGGDDVIANSIVKAAIDDKATIAVTKNYSTAGTYSDGTISGSAIISETGVNLKNITISGDLLIASTVGEGVVDLDNVTVTGKIIINGGGSNSVKLHNMHSKSVELDKAIGENVRVSTDATSSIETVQVSSNGIVDQTTASKKGSITVDNSTSAILKGGFNDVQVNGQGSTVKVVGGSIAILNVNTTSSNTIVDVDITSTVANLNVNAAVKVIGTGTITNANVGANGTTIAITPATTRVTLGVSTIVNGTTKDSTNSTVIASVPVGSEIPTPVGAKVISNIEQLTAAINAQANDQTWIIKDGVYNLPRFDNITAGAQTGWYFPITANNITIIGESKDGVILTSDVESANGNWASQDHISVWGDNVTIKNLTVKPKVGTNKTIEVMGKNFTLSNVDFVQRDGLDYQFAGSLYFNPQNDTKNIGTALVENVLINDAWISCGTAVTLGTLTLKNTTIDFRGSTYANESSGVYGVISKNSVVNVAQNSTFKVLVDNTLVNLQKQVIDRVPEGTAVELAAGTYEIPEQLKITKPITIKGIGAVTIKPATGFDLGTYSTDKHLISINGVSGLVNLENLTISNALRSGINAFESTNVYLNNIRSNDNAAAGLVVNNSVVEADNLKTSGNLWGYGVNVDNGSAPSANAPATSFTLNSGEILETNQIVSDKGGVVIVAPGFKVFIGGVQQ